MNRPSNRPLTGIGRINPSVFEASTVDVSVMLTYLAFRVIGAEDRPLASVLWQSLKEKAQRDDRHQLVPRALSGMTDAIVPFMRSPEDIFLAAALMRDIPRSGFRGEGNSVDAGYFSAATGELKYVDTVSRINGIYQEVVNPGKAADLIARIQAWPDQPFVEIGDASSDEVLKLVPGNERASQIDPDLPDHVKAAIERNDARRGRATLHLMQVEMAEEHPGGSSTPVEIRRVAIARAHMPVQDGALVLGSLEAEALMEMQAAVLNAQERGASLWLFVERNGNQFLAPMPDLMEPGSRQSGWWVPMRQIHVALGGLPETTTALPRWAVMRLMRQLPWFGAADPQEWIRCAWWIQQRGPDAVYGLQPGPRSQRELPDMPTVANANPSPLKRLGWFFGFSV